MKAREMETKLVLLQFTTANKNLIAENIRYKGFDSPQKKGKKNGEQNVEAEEACLLDLIAEVEKKGYRVIDTFYKKRVNPQSVKRCYYAVTFIYGLEGEEDHQHREALMTLCKNSLWNVRVYYNPYFQKGKKVPGACAVSVNARMRTPLFRPNGEPVTVWPKDRNGNRVGEHPLPKGPKNIITLNS